MYLKGNAQFSYLCNPQKSGALRVCFTFPQITQKILTKDIIHLLELITEILSFLQIFSVRKATTQLFNNRYLVPYIYICLYYFLILCSYFHLFLAPLATRHILQFTMFDSISLQPARNITEIKKHFIVHDERKSIMLIITQTNILI